MIDMLCALFVHFGIVSLFLLAIFWCFGLTLTPKMAVGIWLIVLMLRVVVFDGSGKGVRK